MKKWLVLCAVGMFSLCASAIQSAGTLLVDLAASNLTVGVGNKVPSWQNKGLLGGAFTNVVAGQGPELRTYGSKGMPAVYFSRANNNSILAGMPTDARITGGNSWTLETWINIPVLEANQATYFSWTYRGAGPDGQGGPANRLFEARWSRDGGNAIEHHTTNVGWNNNIPAADQWHHIVKTRDGSTQREYIYVDGVQVQNAHMPNVNILPDGIFIIGGTQNGGRNGWDMLATAYIGQIRVHTDFMPLADARMNYALEHGAYGMPYGLALWENATTDPAQLWETPANWVGSVSPAPDTRVAIDNGGSVSLSSPVGLVRSLEVTEGSLHLSGAAMLEMWAAAPGTPLYVANAGGATALLHVEGGLLAVRDTANGTHLVLGSSAGASGTVVVGGGASAARLELSRDILVGRDSGATGQLAVLANGTVARVSDNNGFIYVGRNQAEGTVTVDGGTILYPRITLVDNGGKGVLEMNDGFVRLTDRLYFSAGTAHATSEAIARFNGGVLQTQYFEADKKTGVNAAYFNRGVVRNISATQGDFIRDGIALYVQEGGAVFDVIDGTEITIQRAFLHDSLGAAVDGGLVKKGPGVLRLSGTEPSTFTGDIHVEEGLLFFAKSNLLPGYAGKIRFDNPNAGVGCYEANSIPWMLSLIAQDADGYLVVFAENAAENIDLTNHPYLKVAFRAEMTYSGTITPAVGNPLCLSPLAGAVTTYNQAITGTTALLVEGQGNGTLVLGNSNTYSGGTTVRGGKIRLDNLAQLGTGPITLADDGALLLNANTIDPATLLSRITQTSRGYILVNNSTAGLSFDLSNHPGIYIGSPDSGVTYNGTLTPAGGGDYHVGGGWLAYKSQNATGLAFQSLTDGVSPRGVAVEGDGSVRILNANTFTGDIAVTNRGGLNITSNSDQLGQTSSLYVNNGTVRTAESRTIPARVTVTAGSEGMELNPWGSTYTQFAGALAGDGRIFTSDSGGVFFGNAGAFTGTLDPCREGSMLGVGVGSTFGWNPAIVITNSGFAAGYFGIQSEGELSWSTSIIRPLNYDTPNLGLKKRGSGTLIADVAQAYVYDTLIEQGTLRVAHPSALPSGVGKGQVGVSAGAVLDVNGHELSLNRLINSGLVTDSTDSAQYIRLGVDSVSWTLAAAIDPSLRLIKAGFGTMTVNSPEVYDVTAEEGTVQMVMPAAGIKSDLILAGSSTLQVNDMAGSTGNSAIGLTAYYYQMPDATALVPGTMATLGDLEDFFYSNEPDLFNYTTHAGSTLDFGTTTGTCRFPAPFNAQATENFVAIYRGTFLAPESGNYTFGLQSDDSSIIFIDGQVAASLNQGSHGWNTTVEPGDPIYLDAGERDIAIGFFEIGGGQGLAVWMKTPSASALSLLPQSLLIPADQDLAFPACRAGGVSGDVATRFYVNAGAIVEVGSENVSSTDVFSGTMTNSPYSTLRKTGLGRQVLASQTLSLGYVDVEEGVLELAVPGNAPAFVTSYKSSGNPDANFTGVTLASLNGGAPSGELLLTDGSLLKMNRAEKDTSFAGTIAGSDQTAIVKADNRVLTLKGNNDGFAGTWIIHSGVLNIGGTGTVGTGLVINNSELWVDKETDCTITLTGNGTVVKRGEGTLYVRGVPNATLMQDFIIEGGRVLFDTQDSTLFFAGTVDVGEGCSWGGTGGGKVVVLNTDGSTGTTVAVDGTEWVFQAGGGATSPVQDGLAIALDASNYSMLEVNETGIVTKWTSLVGDMAHTNNNLTVSPHYSADAFGGRGGVMFGTNLVTKTKTETRLSSTAQALVQTVFIVGHVAGGQQGYGGMFGQTAADKGIRFHDPAGSTLLRNSGQDDFLNGGSGACFINGASITLSGNTAGDVGTTPFVLAQYAGSQASWTSPVNTTLGSYYFNNYPGRHYWGLLGEILVYNRKLLSDERAAVEAYLMNKWQSETMPTYEPPEGLTFEMSNGGVLNLGGAAQTVSTVVGGEGGGSVVNGAITITDALVITVKPDGSTDAPAFDNVAFGPNAKLVVNGLEYAKGVVIVFTANSATPVPPFAKESLPKGWSASYRGGVCRLSRTANIIILK